MILTNEQEQLVDRMISDGKSDDEIADCLEGKVVLNSSSDKVSFSDRIQWVHDNREMILSIYNDPIANQQWANSGKPWQSLAWAMEFGSIYHECGCDGDMLWEHVAECEFESHLSINMDGSNNGLQLFSLLLRDKDAAISTNVFPDDVPHDIYQDVADEAAKYMEEDMVSGSGDDQKYGRAWLGFVDGRLPRAAVKRVVMTYAYGLTQHSAREYVEEWYNEQLEIHKLRDNRPSGKTFAITLYLTKHIIKAISKKIVSAAAGMEWMRSVAKQCAELGKPVVWTSPTDMLIEQRTTKYKRVTITTSTGDKWRGKQLYSQIRGDEISVKAMCNGISPNMIHSLDGAILIKTINLCNDDGITDLSLVHDSYGTHAANCPALAAHIRQAIYNTFKDDPLLTFKREVEDLNKVKLQDPPTFGDLNIDCVFNSLYLFS